MITFVFDSDNKQGLAPFTVFFAADETTHAACLEHRDLLERVSQFMTTHGDNKEQLNTSDDCPLFSLRINGKGRLICTSFKYRGAKHYVALEMDNNHKHNTKFFKENVYKAFFDKHADEFKKQIDAQFDALAQNKRLPEPKRTAATFSLQLIDDQIIVLDDVQKNVAIPSIVVGPPGSGKTLITYRLLEENLGQKILYITKSKELIKKAHKQWQQSHLYKENDTLVQIKTYDNLMSDLHIQRNTDKTTRAVFDTWFKDSKHKHFNAEKLYQEFRIISGYTQDEYFDTGKNQSLFEKIEDRRLAYSAYVSWLNYCLIEKKFNLSEFYAFNLADDQKYDLVLVDEALDFSHLQLKMLVLQLSRNGRIVFCMDSRQNLSDDNPKLIYLKQLCVAAGIPIQIVQLEIPYRCAPNIMRVAKVADDLRIAVTPRKKKEVNLKIDPADEGKIVWLSPDKAQLRMMANDASVCIITTSAHQKILMGEGFPQVFTPEDVKGLQYPTAVLYEIFDDENLRVINKNILADGSIKSGSQDIQYSTPLSAIFTAITRAENALYFYQSNRHPVNNIIKLMQKVESQVPLSQQFEVSNKGQWEDKARELWEEFPEQAEAILKHQLKMDTKAMEAWKKSMQLVVATPAASSSSSPSVSPLEQAIGSKNISAIKEHLKKENEFKILIRNHQLQDQLFRLCMVELDDNEDIELLASLIDSDPKNKLQWDFADARHNVGPGMSIIEGVFEHANYLDRKTFTSLEKLFNNKLAIRALSPQSAQLYFLHFINLDLHIQACIFLKSNEFDFETKMNIKQQPDDIIEALLQIITHPSLSINMKPHDPVFQKIFAIVDKYAPSRLFEVSKHFISIRNVDCTTPFLEAAARHKDPHALKAMEKIKANQGQRKAHKSTQIDDIKQVEEIILKEDIQGLDDLLHKNATQHTPWNHQEPTTGMTLLMLACRKSRPDLVLMLMGIMEVNIDICDKKNCSAFHHACYAAMVNPQIHTLRLFFDNEDFNFFTTMDKNAKNKQLLTDSITKIPGLLAMLQKHSSLHQHDGSAIQLPAGIGNDTGSSSSAATHHLCTQSYSTNKNGKARLTQEQALKELKAIQHKVSYTAGSL